jgi:hypothetical protein
VPGEKSLPTQPLPTGPAPFDRQGVTPDDVINRDLAATITILADRQT